MNLERPSKVIPGPFILLQMFLSCPIAYVAVLYIGSAFSSIAIAQYVHKAPIILPAFALRELSGYPINTYRVFRSVNGKAEAIPFQIDEMTKYEDFVLDQGVSPNMHEGDGVFDNADELSFMGEDVGDIAPITSWGGPAPDLSYEVTAEHPSGKKGAVYVGIWFSRAPPLSNKSYVSFNLQQAKISTSRYAYYFDPKNYLVVKGIDVLNDGKPRRLVESSSFFLKADLKYFLTFLVNQSSIVSKLEAYKIGPIRSIVRVSFSYVLLRLNFEMGMYTEVSFFANSVILPAIMYNPLDGAKSLNKGSGFYYGFALNENPASLNVKSTLPSYKESTSSSFFSSKNIVERSYSVTTSSKDWFMQMEIEPSSKMISKGYGPSLYLENASPDEIAKRPLNKALPLGKSPVNLAINFDLSEFSEGEHRVGFRLYFENQVTPQLLESYSTLSLWRYTVKRR
ncbi:MAG: hypothetical protein WCI18_08930 [Pseudomonadota bacterium]